MQASSSASAANAETNLVASDQAIIGLGGLAILGRFLPAQQKALRSPEATQCRKLVPAAELTPGKACRRFRTPFMKTRRLSWSVARSRSAGSITSSESRWSGWEPEHCIHYTPEASHHQPGHREQ
jgi:hypothetical protein